MTRPYSRGDTPVTPGRAVFHPSIQTRSGEQVHCNASATRDIVAMRNRKLAVEVINVNRVCGEPLESFLEDPEAARWASVYLVDEETAPGLEDAPVSGSHSTGSPGMGTRRRSVSRVSRVLRDPRGRDPRLGRERE